MDVHCVVMSLKTVISIKINHEQSVILSKFILVPFFATALLVHPFYSLGNSYVMLFYVP